jgi:hypothetical protein
MSVSDDVIQYTNTRSAFVRSLVSDELSSIVENARWVTTLTLAEIAGIATYREKFSQEHSLSIPFAIAVLILATAVAALAAAVWFARNERRVLSNRLHEVEALTRSTSKDESVSITIGNQQVTTFREAALEGLQASLRESRTLELFGIALFAIGSVLAGICLFGGEFAALFRPK